MKKKQKATRKMLTTSKLELLRNEIKDLERRILYSVQMDNWSIEPRILSDEEECRVSYSLPEAK